MILKRIPQQWAIRVIYSICCLAIIVHLLVIVNILPSKYVWGGKIKDSSSSVILSLIAILINAILLLIVFVKLKAKAKPVLSTIIKGVLLFYALLYALNTIGNLLAESTIETLVFTPLTLLLSVACFRLIIK